MSAYTVDFTCLLVVEIYSHENNMNLYITVFPVPRGKRTLLACMALNVHIFATNAYTIFAYCYFIQFWLSSY